jgi:NAD(P)-dependent dehydrogenase (short-subunit alcohol dehydrogenase family)
MPGAPDPIVTIAIHWLWQASAAGIKPWSRRKTMADRAGQVAVITGGGRGFGEAFAEALAAEGVAVALLDLDLASAEAVAARLVGAGRTARAYRCDVADEVEVGTTIDRVVADLGGIDVLINNAGLHSEKYNRPFQALTHADLRALFDVNVHGVINCTLAARPALAARKGSIVNIASISAYRNRSPYGVSKLAVRGLTIAFAGEFAPDAIRVNAIAPGLTGTDTILAELPEALRDQIVNQHQLIHRLGRIDDIVQMMLYLTGPNAGFITGETYKVSGGYPLQI